MKKNKKAWLAALLVLVMTATTGCGRTVDTKNDPLSDYSVDSVLPFPSRDPELASSESPEPSVSPSVSPSAPAQDWQGESAPVSEATPTVAPAATARTYTRLESGSEGEDVLALQNRLIELGYLTGTADGKYGTQTQNAIKLFQKALGISQTGIANVSLQEKLFSANAPAYAASATAAPSTDSGVTASGYTTLVRGDSGDNVRSLQSRLKELGYLSGSVDGSFGGQTESAVKAFQKALGLTQSGVASSSLQEKLFAADAPKAAVTVTAAPATAAPTATAAPAAPTATPGVGGYSELSYGMKNSLAVQNMQNRLKELGYFTAQSTGNYYSQTAEAVKLFQKAVGLSATGTATAEMQVLLYAASAPAYTAATTAPAATATPAPGTYAVLSKGSRGTEVTNLQKRLIALGWASGSADGIYGNQTVSAVKAFQAAVGYTQDGIAGVELQTILFSAVAPANTATATPTVTATPAPSSNYPALKAGDTGERVKALQQRLKDLGYFSGTIGGNYLTKTTAAVKLFEAALGRTQTGEASSELQEILFSAAAPAYSDVNVGYSQLVKGDSGLQVTSMQKRLIELGWLSGTADGDYGSNTEKAVKAFQAAASLTQSGTADIDTLNRLYSDSAPSYTAPAPVVTDAPAVTQAPTATNPPASSSYQALQPGDSGDLVAAMQRRLKELGYFNGNIVGNYKDLTTAAVKRFQAAMGYTQDGVASSALLEALYASSAPAYDPTVSGYIGLVSGNTGSAVTAMQQRLIELGWLSGSADGDYGGNTAKAVKAFQSAAGLTATGEADSDTLTMLYSAYAPGNTTPAVTAAPATEPPVVDEPSIEEGYTVLSNGSSGDAVKRLQQRLIELGWLSGSADGEYGAATAQAVAAFQYQIAQPQDGVAGIELQERLFAADAHAYAEYEDLYEGMTGEAVLAVQMRLIALGYLDNTEANTDGEYGPLMTNAIALLQSNSGALPEDVDGLCDIDFQTFLFSDNALAFSLIDVVG